MLSSYTESYTYTVADVRKVMDQVRADMRMAAESSGAMTLARVDSIMGDVTKYAENEYLSRLLIRLLGADGTTLKAAEYEILTDAGMLTASHAGNMMWPRVTGTSIVMLVTTNDAYDRMDSASKDEFEKTLSNSWEATKAPSLAHLAAIADRNYVSKAYGVKKTSYA